MKNTLIIGASGQIGKKLTQSMVDNQQNVVAFVRDKSKISDIKAEQLAIVEGDLKEDFSHAFSQSASEQCDTVVFVAGSGGSTGADLTLLIDLWAACRAVDYAKANNVKHFVMVSSIGADKPEQGPEEMQPYLVAKHMADEHLINSGLLYSIIRPGSLTDSDPSSKFTSERPAQKDQATISRGDVAKALLYCVNHPPTDKTIVELFNGEKPIEEVL
ncbi:SDR family oxidoreductase [Aliiglaciecola lipolytica]|uniref:NAD-dependent epimerase/dehydratase n=1 Tax=Aliiglaciecola lipolytica E3 TaxID=1127673 RepID=K6YPH5_9ALTE|nr:SDR family oxidoreductase [Aliiglaciecola lipolytica]GAC13235.1 NAD-dependent epimerase/dehydratase [Aliiglaciecola lipolytica E3]